MGAACCNASSSDEQSHAVNETIQSETKSRNLDDGERVNLELDYYRVKLSKADGGKLGIDVDYTEENPVLPIVSINGGLAAAWNKTCGEHSQLKAGDTIVEINGATRSLKMLEMCKHDIVLEMVVKRFAPSLGSEASLADIG
eukprot:TRINITY_DN65730_c0_g1_i1.p1 TRINITY_DN65730_c0_g1~~TRINITY_DN65730_c0_g1_i1.p1  ORF type:complete len:142 (+),score=24.13 TRINITY_DN65730_c0_g1_i1:84-509(+)